MSDLRRSVSDLSEEPEGAVTFGITPSLADDLLIPLIERCRQRFPGINLSVTEDMSYSIVELIELGQLDLGLVFSVKPTRGLRIDVLATEGVCLLTRASGSTTDLGAVEFSALDNVPMILPRRPNRLRVVAEESAQRCKIKLNIAFEMQSLSSILRLVEHGYGATLIAVTGSAQRAAGGRLVSRPVINPGFTHNISLVHLDSKPLSRAELAVAGILRELTGNMSGPAGKKRHGLRKVP
jgi:LysR family nitrogen assimilation transcriptional regulator